MKAGLVCPYSWDVPGGVQEHIRDLAEALMDLWGSRTRPPVLTWASTPLRARRGRGLLTGACRPAGFQVPAGITSASAAAAPGRAGDRRPGTCPGGRRDLAGLPGSLRGGGA
jgi:hypothetical protein